MLLVTFQRWGKRENMNNIFSFDTRVPDNVWLLSETALCGGPISFAQRGMAQRNGLLYVIVEGYGYPKLLCFRGADTFGKFDFVTSLDTTHDGEQLLAHPFGLALDGDGNAYIADPEKQTVVKVTADDGGAQVFIKPKCGRLLDVAIANGILFVCCPDRGTVCMFSIADGSELGESVQFDFSPVHLAIHNGGLYVVLGNVMLMWSVLPTGPKNISLAFRSVDIDLSWIDKANQLTGIGRISFSDDGKRVYVPFQRGFESGVIFSYYLEQSTPQERPAFAWPKLCMDVPKDTPEFALYLNDAEFANPLECSPTGPLGCATLHTAGDSLLAMANRLIADVAVWEKLTLPAANGGADDAALDGIAESNTTPQNSPTDNGFFAGFNSENFPGVLHMSWLKSNTNLSWCGFYLAPTPCHGNRAWMPWRGALEAQGWGMAPLYIGQQISKLAMVNLQQGLLDGAHAAALMVKAGFSAKSRVFLFLENDPPMNAAQCAYVVAWANEVEAREYVAAVCCPHSLAHNVALTLPGAQIWVCNHLPDDLTVISDPIFTPAAPADSGYAAAMMWQSRKAICLSLEDMAAVEIDVSSSTVANPTLA